LSATPHVHSYIIYGEKVLAGGASAKMLVRDLSEAPAYALLFMGGKIEADFVK
jgi:hypothetical protein